MDPPVARPGCSQEELIDVERCLRSNLPEQYREFLTSCREFRAQGPGTGLHIFSPYCVVSYLTDTSTPNRLLDAIAATETAVITVGMRGGEPLLLATSGTNRGALYQWPKGHEVRFDGASTVKCTETCPSLSDLLDLVVKEWEAQFSNGQYPNPAQ